VIQELFEVQKSDTGVVRGEEVVSLEKPTAAYNPVANVRDNCFT
jgi:hypothetical protein